MSTDRNMIGHADYKYLLTQSKEYARKERAKLYQYYNITFWKLGKKAFYFCEIIAHNNYVHNLP